MGILFCAFNWERVFRILGILIILSRCFLGAADAGAGTRVQGKIGFLPVQEQDESLWNQTLVHPYRFSQQELSHMLGRLYFARKLTVGWDSPEPVFDQKIVASLAGPFQTFATG